MHLRAARAEQQVADLKAALENIKTERDRWRTIAERRSLPDQPAESTLARRESRDWWWRVEGQRLDVIAPVQLGGNSSRWPCGRRAANLLMI